MLTSRLYQRGNDLRVIILLLALFLLMGMATADNLENKAQLEENNAAYDNPTTSEEKNLKFSIGTECDPVLASLLPINMLKCRMPLELKDTCSTALRRRTKPTAAGR